MTGNCMSGKGYSVEGLIGIIIEETAFGEGGQVCKEFTSSLFTPILICSDISSRPSHNGFGVFRKLLCLIT